MTWIKLDDQFPDHPKVAQAGALAELLYVNALAYASRYLTDGFIPHAIVAKLVVWDFEGAPSNYDLAERLVAAGLWELVEGGYRIHDYLDYNPSREQVFAEREIARRRAAMNADPNLAKAVRARDGNRCRYCGRIVDWQNRKGQVGGTYDHVIPTHKGGTESIDNIVVCCRSCNLKKGAHTPEEAGMMLLPPPSQNQVGIKTESERDQTRNKTESRQPDPDPDPNIDLEATKLESSCDQEIEATKTATHMSVGNSPDLAPAAMDKSLSPRKIAELWNATCGDLLPRVMQLTDARKRKIASRLAADPERHSEDWWRAYFARIRASPFCCGEGNRGWRANFDWAVRSEQVVVSVLEGKYDDHRPSQAADSIADSWEVGKHGAKPGSLPAGA